MFHILERLILTDLCSSSDAGRTIFLRCRIRKEECFNCWCMICFTNAVLVVSPCIFPCQTISVQIAFSFYVSSHFYFANQRWHIGIFSLCYDWSTCVRKSLAVKIEEASWNHTILKLLVIRSRPAFSYALLPGPQQPPSSVHSSYSSYQ